MNYKWYKKNFCLFLFLTYLCFQGTFYTFANEAENTEASSTIKIERHFVFETIPKNLKEIIDDSNRIFTGKCIRAEEIEDDPESKLPVIKYIFKVSEGIRGVKTGGEVTFKQWQPTIRGANYEVGKKYVLFLYPDSSRGLTSPVGFSQGQFNVEKKGILRRKEVVFNKLKNLGLSRNLKTQKKINIANKYINDYVHQCSEVGAPMRYKEFIEAVKYLAEN